MTAVQTAPTGRNSLPWLALGALGVVYGDIGTSPLYAVKESIAAAKASGADLQTVVYGVLSLVFWAVTIVVSLKYVLFIMQADNKGEGGILALMAKALQVRPEAKARRTVILGAAMVGAALFYGDAMITPAISVLSAVEGLEVIAPQMESIVVPAALVVLVLLFAIQSRGTGAIGRIAGPITAIYFIAIAVLGIAQIVQRPDVMLAAINPLNGAMLVAANPHVGFMTLGAVFLAVTGAEAVYADMGHFGAPPIRLAWFALVFPALFLNYAGQGALVLLHPEKAENPFYLMVPEWALLPMIILATLATIIASQAVISGAYSLTRQAIQLGLLPRMRVLHTSHQESGQIYLPAVNWLLLAAVAWLVLAFKSSTALANAYGIAVTGTMVATSIIAFFVMRDVWKWPTWRAVALTSSFLVIDLTFLSANMLKFVEGGWLPVATGVALVIAIWTWRDGRGILFSLRASGSVPLDGFISTLGGGTAERVSGTAVYMTPDTESVPSALLHNLKHNRVLHERIVMLTVRTEETPRVDDAARLTVEALPKRFYRVILRYGFMEKPDVTAGLEKCEGKGLAIDMMQTSFFLGRENLVPSVHPRMALWRENLFIALNKLSQSAPDFFSIPADRVIEVGTKVEI
ncbi:MAG: potassium transporter Kup [Micropepsaceae bacterium]